MDECHGALALNLRSYSLLAVAPRFFIDFEIMVVAAAVRAASLNTEHDESLGAQGREVRTGERERIHQGALATNLGHSVTTSNRGGCSTPRLRLPAGVDVDVTSCLALHHLGIFISGHRETARKLVRGTIGEQSDHGLVVNVVWCAEGSRGIADSTQRYGCSFGFQKTHEYMPRRCGSQSEQRDRSQCKVSAGACQLSLPCGSACWSRSLFIVPSRTLRLPTIW